MHDSRAPFPSTASTPEAPPPRPAYPITTLTGADAMRHRLAALGLEAASDLLQAQLPQPAWLVRNVVSEGVSLLVAKPKVGKSLAGLEIAISIATGGLCFGKYETTPGDVVYFAFEGARAGHQQRLRKQLGAAAVPESLHMAYELPPLDKGGIERLYEIHEALPSLRLIVIDVLRYVRPETNRRSTLYDEDYGALQPLQEFYSKTGVSVLAIHHSRKDEVASNPLDVVSGSTGLTGSATNILVMTGSAQQKRAQITVVSREQESGAIDLDFDAERLSWVAAQPALPLAGSPEQQRVLQACLDAEGPVRAKYIAEKTGLSYDSVRQFFGKLVRDGHLMRVGSGLYQPHQSLAASTVTITENQPALAPQADTSSAPRSTSPDAESVSPKTCVSIASSGARPIATISDLEEAFGFEPLERAPIDDEWESEDFDWGPYDDEELPLPLSEAPATIDVPMPLEELASMPLEAAASMPQVASPSSPVWVTEALVVEATAPMPALPEVAEYSSERETAPAAGRFMTAAVIIPTVHMDAAPAPVPAPVADAPSLTPEQERERRIQEAALRASLPSHSMPRAIDRAAAHRTSTGLEPEWPARPISDSRTLFGPNGEVNR